MCGKNWGGASTEFFNFTRGVRQGCPLSPTLFNIYVNDIFEMLNKNTEANIFLNVDDPINALMYADDLILLSETKEGLQKQIDKLSDYCDKWKLNINLRKTKIMIFNRGNNLIKFGFTVNNVLLENVKSMKYLGFIINAKNCSFSPTLDHLCVKANRVIYALNSKIKISKYPIKLALKLFNTLIKPILLYGSEVWGPYTDFDYITWEKSIIERTHTQFLKRVLGCNFQTSNIMTRGEMGVRPLLMDINMKVVTYMNNIHKIQQSIVYTALKFESNNEEGPNFCNYLKKFGFVLGKSKNESKKMCMDSYDRFWISKLTESPKAIMFSKIKYNVSLEKYLYEIKNIRYKIALSRFRLSNHSLLIETGRYSRPKIERDDRKCFICKDEIEDEQHFVTKCPLYSEERKHLYKSLRNNSKFFDSLNTDQKFIFIMTNEDKNVMRQLGKFVFNSMKIRDKQFL